MAMLRLPLVCLKRRLGATTSWQLGRSLHSARSPCMKPVTVTTPTSTVARLPEYSKSHKRIQQPGQTYNFIDNRLSPSDASTWTDVHDPATNELVTRVPQSTEEELQSAVDSAQRAFGRWKTTSILHRQQFMFRFVSLIRQNWDRLATTITLEQGKTFADARGDVLRGLQVAETACGITTQLTGDVLEVSQDMETRTYREPIGVVAAICPFNFPAMIPLWTIPIAIVTGNCVILKPSERAPGAAMILADLAKQAGLPDGVLNVIHGAAKTVDFILDEPIIQAISFVGGNRAGEYIYRRGTANGKRVQANLGAKNHAVVVPDCDEDQAIPAIIGAAFGAAGQRCMALTTLLMVGSTRDWLPDLVAQARRLKVDGGFEADVDLGPVISRFSKDRIEELIASAEHEGADILLDGRGVLPEKNPLGNWIGPTIIANVTTTMRCYREEIFGPVLICMTVPTLSAAMEMINGNEYGNGVALFTTNGLHARRFQHGIHVGQVGINVPIPVPLPIFSFTGNKKSVAGPGCDYFYGPAALNFFTRLKTVTSLWRGRPHDHHDHENAVNIPTPT